MVNIEYSEADQSEMDVIGPLWQKLRSYHEVCSPHFSEHFARMTFDLRKKRLLEKSRSGTLRIDLARDVQTGVLVGYCVSTVTGDKQGEIESIYVEQDYRRSGIGDSLMKRTLRWMDNMPVSKKIVVAAVGNEEALSFYSRYGFYPRITTLEQVETR